ncbi:MAG: isopentenyl-diphosphate Delta-isomerase [Gemmatimonadales bacterium]
MIDEQERVILVSDLDEIIGEAGKLDVHRTGQLHRAFSVLVLDDRGRVLLQRRADSKYHSPGLWSNTCCGHPRPGERTVDAAERRLREEMGFSCKLAALTSFVYRANLAGDLIEHELDHVFVGTTSETPQPDETEIGSWRWLDRAELHQWMQQQPEDFTAWFPTVFDALNLLTTQEPQGGREQS